MMSPVRLSHLRELLAELEDAEGDLEVRFPAMVTPDDEDSNTTSVDAVVLVVHPNQVPAFALICDAYTAEGATI